MAVVVVVVLVAVATAAGTTTTTTCSCIPCQQQLHARRSIQLQQQRQRQQQRPLSLIFWFWTTLMMSFMWKSSSGGSSVSSSSSSSITVTLDSQQQQLPHHNEQLLVASGAFFTVDNGYDQPQGDQPLCWQAQTILPVSSSSSSTNSDNKSQNPLPPQSSYFDNNSNSGPGTTNTARISPFFSLFPSCPKGTQLQVHLLSGNNNNKKTGVDMQEEKQLELLPDGTWMGLTDVAYEYIVHGTVDLNQWINASRTTTSTSNNIIIYNRNNPFKIGISMSLCSIEHVRFCSPFLHYDTTATTTVGGALHGGTHIDSDIHYATLGSDSTFSTSITVQVQEPGAFSIVVGAFFYYAVDDTTTTFSNSTTQPQQYYYHVAQISNAAQDYPVIAFWRVQVSRPARLAAYVLIAASGCVLLALLLYTLQHRKTEVLKATQGNVLIAMLVFSLLTTVAALTFEPRNSLYCYLQGPLVILPLHILFAILLGRLWRIQVLISPLLLITLDRNDTWSDKLVEFLRRITEVDINRWKKGCVWRCRGAAANKNQSPTTADTTAAAPPPPPHQPNGSIMNSVRSSWMQSIWNRRRGGGNQKNNKNHPSVAASVQRPLRCTVTEAQLARVVAIFCLPQVVVQVVYLVFGQEHLLNGVCSTDFLHSPTSGFGGIVLFLLVVLLLSLARSSKHLPSLFNESEALWEVSLRSLVLLSIAYVVTIITNSPTTKPEIRYLADTLTVTVITTNTCFKILFPILRKIWQNEKVIVSKLISDHNRMERKKVNGGVEYIPQERWGDHHHHEQQQDVDNYNTNRRHGGSIIATTHGSDSPPNKHLSTTQCTDHDDDEESVITVPFAEEPLSHGQQTSTLQSISVDDFPDEYGRSSRIDSDSDRVQYSGSSGLNRESYRRNSFGLPSRSSMLSSPSYNIPEHASVQSALNDRTPSSAGSVPASEPSPSAVRIARASRMMNGRRGPHASIVRNRARMSLSSNRVRQTRKSCNDMPTAPTPLAASPTSAANNNHYTGSIRFSVFRPKIDKRNVQHLDIAVNPKKREQSIHVSVDGDTDEPLSRRLLLPMIDVHHTLGLVNRALLSGDQVMREDWEFLREGVVALGRLFEEEVVFDWEPTNDELDVPAYPSAPLARGSAYPSTIYANRERPPSYVPPGSGQVSFASSTGSRPPSKDPGATTSNAGPDALAPSSIAASPGRSAPFSRDRLNGMVVSGGGIISNILQNLPRPHSGHRHLRRPASLENSNNRRQQHEIRVRRASVQQPLSMDTRVPVPGPTILQTIQSSDIDKDNDVNKAVDNIQDDSVNERPMDLRILPQSGRSFPRSQFHAAARESFTSVDSLAPGLLFQTSDPNFTPTTTLSTATSPPLSIVARTSTTLRRQNSRGLIGSFSASPRSSTVEPVTIQIHSSTLSDSSSYHNADNDDNSDEKNRDVSNDDHGSDGQSADEEED